jgi:hypothetical protein
LHPPDRRSRQNEISRTHQRQSKSSLIRPRLQPKIKATKCNTMQHDATPNQFFQVCR